MKFINFTSLISMFLVGMFAFSSCDDNDDELVPELKILTESIEASSKGGIYPIEFSLVNAKNDLKVEAKAGAEWVDIKEIKDNTVLLDVHENLSYDESRKTEVFLSYPGVQGVFKCSITQSASERPIIEIGSTSIDIPSEGAEGVEISCKILNAKEGVLPILKSSADWITNVAFAEDVIRFNVNPNDTPEKRTTDIEVSYEDAKSVSFIVSQAEGAKDINITAGNVSFKMIYIKAGTFMMGGSADDKNANSWEKPSHKVTLTQDYYMGEYEVTQQLWTEIMGENPSQYKGDELLPVENVNYKDVQDFIEKLNKKTGKTFVLPTEAQWEYAARGGNKSNNYIYAGGNSADDVSWYDSNAGFKTHCVGQKAPNELGLYDMSGNVMEWCSDWYGNYTEEEQIDPQGIDSNSQNYRVSRGGGFISLVGDVRVIFRAGSEENSRMFFQGFRLVMIK